MQRILAGFGTLRDLVADVRARLADAAAKDATRAEQEEARDRAIAARLIDPEALGAHARAGARQGASETLAGAATDLKHRITADADARELLTRQLIADQADRHTGEMRRRQRDRWWNGALAAFALMIPAAYAYGHYGGNQTGEATGYARSRDEVAAVSWANTPNGKLARAIDQASQLTLPDIANCPEENGWHSVKQNGRRVCYGTSSTAKMITGWTLP